MDCTSGCDRMRANHYFSCISPGDGEDPPDVCPRRRASISASNALMRADGSSTSPTTRHARTWRCCARIQAEGCPFPLPSTYRTESLISSATRSWSRLLRTFCRAREGNFLLAHAAFLRRHATKVAKALLHKVHKQTRSVKPTYQAAAADIARSRGKQKSAQHRARQTAGKMQARDARAPAAPITWCAHARVNLAPLL